MSEQTHLLPVDLPFGRKTRARFARRPAERAVVFVHGFGGEAVRRLPEGDPHGSPERGVEGFRTFLGFCADFDTFLQSGAKYAELHSAFWHYHGYWFRNMKALVGPLMHEAIDNLMSWNAELALSVPNEPEQELIAAQAKELHTSIDRLTSGVYARPLEKLV